MKAYNTEMFDSVFTLKYTVFKKCNQNNRHSKIWKEMHQKINCFESGNL